MSPKTTIELSQESIPEFMNKFNVNDGDLVHITGESKTRVMIFLALFTSDSPIIRKERMINKPLVLVSGSSIDFETERPKQ